MKTMPSLVLVGAALLLAAAPVFGQPPAGEPKGPAAKIYIADAKGEGLVASGGKMHPTRQGAAFNATGTVIETKAKAYNAVVYSNGTGLFVDENTRVEIERFVQQPFQARNDNTLDPVHEPSMSQSTIRIAHGAVAICTNQLRSGSTMTYVTPLATVAIRSGKLVIEVLADETHVDLLDGDVTVQAAGKETGGQLLRAGERAVIRPAAAGMEPALTLMPIPDDARKKDEQRVARACAGRRAVTFEALAVTGDSDEAAGAGDQELVARPTVPSDPPSNIVISPDRLPGT